MSNTARAARPARAVSFVDLGRELGLDVNQRHDIVREGLVKPITPPRRGVPIQITEEDAARVRAAVLLAAAVGLAVVIVLRLLAGSGASVSGSAITIPVPSP